MSKIKKNITIDIKDILSLFDELAHFKLLSESEKTFKIKDLLDNTRFEVSKKEWYQKIQDWVIEEVLMDRDIMRGFNYNDVFENCLRVAKLEKYIKMAVENEKVI